jgi:hypothetical protein
VRQKCGTFQYRYAITIKPKNEKISHEGISTSESIHIVAMTENSLAVQVEVIFLLSLARKKIKSLLCPPEVDIN